MWGVFYAGEEGVKKKSKRRGGCGEFLGPILTLVIVVLGAIYLYGIFQDKGLLAAVDLNNYNFAFLIAGMLLHWTPRSYLRAAGKAVPMTSGILLQFPLYAGIFGVLVGSGLTEVLAKFFVSISTQQTLPFVIGVYRRAARNKNVRQNHMVVVTSTRWLWV